MANRRCRRVDGDTELTRLIIGTTRQIHELFGAGRANGLLLEARLAQGPAAPRVAVLVPAVEGDERHALPRRLDQPAVAEVERRMVDLARRRAAAVPAEEHDVGGLQLRGGD